MDEATFQKELIQLKNRVAHMTSTYYRLPSVFPSYTPPTMPDAFAHQLDDVKTRLNSMQCGLGYLIAERSQQQVTPSQVRLGDSAAFQAQNMFPPNADRLTLPSGPLFWQLFTSLRTDVRGLNNRVAALELNFSDLESRVERLEPHMDTQAAQTNETAAFEQWIQSLQTHPSFEAGMHLQHAGGNTAAHHQLDAAYFQGNIAGDHSLSVNANVPVPQPASLPAAEGVAFRDREITQLEELIRQTQENLRRNEDLVGQRDAQLRQLGCERQRQDTRIGELEGIVSEQDEMARSYGKEITQLETDLEFKDALLRTRVTQLAAIQQAFLRKKTQLSHAGRHAQELERSFRDLQASKKTAIDEVTASKDEEIAKLRRFCEAKEALVSRQEDIISRGARIIQERDEEIERLNRELAKLGEDQKRVQRMREDFAKVMNATNRQEFDQLAKSMGKSRTPPSRPLKNGHSSAPPADLTQPRDGESLIQCSPFATAGGTSRPQMSPEQWSPRPIARYNQLPHEQQRASVWGEVQGPHINPRYKFGVPGVATPPAHQQPLNKANDEQRRDLRRSDSLKLLQRLALVEEGGNVPAKGMTERTDRNQRQRLPLDDMCRPLPAPLPPRNPASRASVAELGSAARRENDFGPDGLLKRRSLQELPRRNLQAYVEEGGEQGGQE